VIVAPDVVTVPDATPEIAGNPAVVKVLFPELTEVPPASVEVTLKLYRVPGVSPVRITACAVASVTLNVDEEP
jgi:hypothetical protein